MMNKRMLSSLVIVAVLTLSSVAFGAGTTSILPGALLNGPGHAPDAPDSPASDTPQGTSPAASSSSGYAFTLVSLKQETVGGLSRILVESSTPPLYAVMRPSDQLIVINLPGADGSKLLKQYAINSPMIERITVHDAASNFSESSAAGTAGARATRIEIGIKGRLKDRSMLDGNTLVLELSAEDNATSTAGQSNAAATAQARLDSKGTEIAVGRDLSASQAQPATRPLDARKTSSATGRSDVYVYPESVKGEARPATGSPMRQATILRSVRAEASSAGTRILVDADGLAQYKDFTLTNPSRIVVDFQGVRSEFGNKTLSVDGGPVERVRVGQPGPNTVRVVIDSKSKLPYNIARQGASLVIAVGDASTLMSATANPAALSATTVYQPEVRPSQKSAGESASQTSSAAAKVTPTGSSSRTQGPVDSRAAVSSATAGKPDARVSATASQLSSTAGSSSSQARPQPGPGQAGDRGVGALQATVISGPASAKDASTTQAQNAQARPRQKGEAALCDSGYVGGPISFDLRAGVDIRDMLRFISQQYGVNFVMDKSVGAVPVELKITEVPWNRVMESVLRANGLGWVCDDGGKIVRVATLSSIKDEQTATWQLGEEREKAKPLQTWIRRLRYARAWGTLANNGQKSNINQTVAVPVGGQAGNNQTGTLLSIVSARLSRRGRVEVDARTNSLIVTDTAENIQIIQQMVDTLDRPEPQVEIEARIVVASHNFLRDLGVQLATAAQNINRGATALLETAPSLLAGRTIGGPGTSANSSGTGTGTGAGSASQNQNQIGPGLPFGLATNDLRGPANTVLGLTTGALGTNIISAALAASETKGQIRTIATPRITAQDNARAEIVNGVQIPVQTISNNTVSTTFITAALRLEITPQIIEDNGEVLMRIVAENNTVNTALANSFNGGTPGINTQSADSMVRVKDGGTAVMGGINIDSESNTQNRTPGVSRVPLLGELFKRRTVSRQADEILFFVTPRIVRSEGEAAPNAGAERSSAAPLTSPENKSTASPVAPATAAVASSGSGK